MMDSLIRLSDPDIPLLPTTTIRHVSDTFLTACSIAWLWHCLVLDTCRGKSISPCPWWSCWSSARAPRASPFSSWSRFAGWLHQSWQRESQTGEGGNHQGLQTLHLPALLDKIYNESPLLFVFRSQHVGVPVDMVVNDRSHLCRAKLLDKLYLW